MFRIKIADLVIEINNRYRYVKRLCGAYIYDGERKTDFAVQVSKPELQAEVKKYPDYSKQYCESICIYRQIGMNLVRYNGFIMHSAAVEMNGEAYLFLARSGGGKSTHAALWLSAFGENAHMINGDKPVMRKMNGIWNACGTPWQGKESNGNNICVPVHAACFIEKNRENHIRKAEKDYVNREILNQIIIPRDESRILSFLDILDDFVFENPFYVLKCNMKKEAAELAYRKMGK